MSVHSGPPPRKGRGARGFASEQVEGRSDAINLDQRGEAKYISDMLMVGSWARWVGVKGRQQCGIGGLSGPWWGAGKGEELTDGKHWGSLIAGTGEEHGKEINLVLRRCRASPQSPRAQVPRNIYHNPTAPTVPPRPQYLPTTGQVRKLPAINISTGVQNTQLWRCSKQANSNEGGRETKQRKGLNKK